MREVQNETSSPEILASGRGRCRAAGRLTLRLGANLSDAAGARDCWLMAARLFQPGHESDGQFCASTGRRTFTRSGPDVLSSTNVALPCGLMNLSRLLGLASLCFPLAGTTWAQAPEICPMPEWSKTVVDFQKWTDDLIPPESQWTKECLHPTGWRPTEDELQRILSRHSEWTKDWGLLASRELMLESAAVWRTSSERDCRRWVSSVRCSASRIFRKSRRVEQPSS